MNKFLIVIFIQLLIFKITYSEIKLSAFDSLINNKKYLTAYQLLDSMDNNSDPDICIKKTEVLLNYFVISFMHQLFALKDLSSSENIEDIRGKAGKYQMFKFEADSILSKLIEKYPEDWRLYKSLGEYYYEVHFRYNGQWLESNDTLIARSKRNYLIALENGVSDSKTHFVLGYYELLKDNYAHAISYFKESIRLCDTFPTSYYNLAYAYLFQNEREKAIANAKQALALYKNPEQKSDAACMLGQIYKELEDIDQSIKYYQLSNRISPNHYYTLKSLIPLLIYNAEVEKADSLSECFFKIEPTNPIVLQDLTNFYFDQNRQKELFILINKLKRNYKKEMPIIKIINKKKVKNISEILGNIYFHSAVAYREIDNTKLATNDFIKAKKYFQKSYDKDHYVFGVIDKQLNEIKNK